MEQQSQLKLFVVRLGPREREVIDRFVSAEERTKSDVVRRIIREAGKQLPPAEQKP